MQKKESMIESLRNGAKTHRDFRHYYSDRQNITMARVSLITLAYAILGLIIALFISEPITGYTYVKLLGLAGISIVVYLFSFIARSKRLFRDDLSRERFSYVYVIVSVLIYIVWGFVVMHFSITEEKATNFMLALMVYAICSIFLYFRIEYYVVGFIICVAGALTIVFAVKKGDFDSTILSNVLAFGMILTIGGITKYISAEKRFFAEQSADELKATLESNNKKLTEANTSLVETTERLQNYIESQRLFNASMNHELRSPLNGVIGLLQILKERSDLPESAAAQVNDAYESSQEIIQIVNDLLDYARLESGELSIVKDKFDLRTMVENVEKSLKPQAELKNIDFIVDIDSFIPCLLMGDGLRIQQIVTNLLSNAIKYTDKGYVKLRMFVDHSRALKIVVADTGQGMLPEAKEELLRPASRLTDHRNKYVQGTGIGLTIVMNLIKHLNGEIELDTSLGKGSTFTVRVPIEVVDSRVRFGERNESAAKKTQQQGEDASLAGIKLLCVDDNMVNLVVFKGLFGGTGATVKTVLSGKSALEEITKNKYDLIFLDHMMPGMDGVEVFETMKGMEPDINLNYVTPVVMLTANASGEAEERYKKMGFAGYLPKPVIKEDILRLTSELVKM